MRSVRRASGLFFFAALGIACSAGEDASPPMESTNHVQIKDMVKQNKGKVVLVNVWATWCAPCREEMPALLKLRKEYRDRGFELILVSADDPEFTRSKVRPMLREFGVDFPTFINHDSTDEAFIAGMHPDWNGALPTSFVYGRDGRLVDIMIGGKTYQQFEEIVKRLLHS